MLYYIAVKASIAKKNIFSSSGFLGAKFFAIILLIVLFFNLGSAKAQTGIPAANVNFDEFACLFTKTDNNGKCTHNPDAENIKTGAESGVVYGKTNSFTDKGVTSITMQLGLWADIEKENKESKYHFSRVADDRNATFLLRLKYEPVAGYPVYKLIDIPYQEDNVEVFGNANIRTINMDLTKGSSQVKIGFYKLGPSGPETVTQQVINAVVDTKMPSGTTIEIPFGATISADFWYCAGEKQSSRPSALEQAQGLVNPVDGRRAPKNDPQRPDLLGRVEYFTTDGKYTDKIKSHDDGISYGITKCDGTAYFKIGETITFKLPESREAAQADSQKQLDSGIVSSEYIGSVLPLCSIDPFTNGSVMGCVAQILYGGVFRPVAFFAQLMGQIFDFFLGYSLSDESYRHDFIQTGWQLVRDISNIFFIIIMVWSGLIAVFNTKKASYKQVIPTLIINALIINFSLFATRIVIDLSNITARIFYNQMVVKVGGEVVSGDTGFKPISEAIVSSFNPQSIFRNSVLQSEDLGSDTESGSATSADFNSQSKNQTQGAKFKRYSREYASYFALVTLLAIMITFSVAVMFWKTAFIFVGRVVGLYVAMIFSPFAFLSRGGLPLVSKIPSLNFGSWWGDLYKYALVAPIFVFFLYIINAFLNVEFFQKVGLDQNGQGFFGSVMYVLIPMLIIYTLVTKGVKVAETFAGDIGKMASSFGNNIGGLAGGVIAGGTALVGRRIIGGAAARLENSRFGAGVRSLASQSGLAGKIGRRLESGLKATSGGSFDIRNTEAGKQISSGLGVNLNQKPLNILSGVGLGMGTDQTKGGYDAEVKRKQEEIEKKQKLLEEKMSDDDIKKYNQKEQDKRADRIEALIEKSMIATHGKNDVKDWKKNDKAKYDAEKAVELQKSSLISEISKVPPAKEMKSVSEINRDRRKQFVENLKKEGLDGFLNSLPLIGSALGAGVRLEANKKAAKKIGEDSKIEKELADIESTLKKGFQDLIALDLFQNSNSFTTNISDSERQDIIKFGTIQNGNNKGKGMYDILTDSEKAKIDQEIKNKKDAMSRGTEDEKKKAKEEYEEYEDLIKARESNKYDLKSLRETLKKAKEAWINTPTDSTLKDNFRNALKEVKIAEKHQDKFRDLNNYIKTRRDKLKGEDKK